MGDYTSETVTSSAFDCARRGIATHLQSKVRRVRVRLDVKGLGRGGRPSFGGVRSKRRAVTRTLLTFDPTRVRSPRWAQSKAEMIAVNVEL